MEAGDYRADFFRRMEIKFRNIDSRERKRQRQREREREREIPWLVGSRG